MSDTAPRFGRAQAVLAGTLAAMLLLSACAPAAPAAPTAAPAAKPTEAPKPVAPATAPAAAKPTAASKPAAAASPATAAKPTAAAPAKPAATTAPAAKPAAGGTPRRGGTAIVAVDADPETLNLAATTGYSAGDVGSKIFEGLVWLDTDIQAKPALATSWEITPDGKTYTFKLRQGVKWHDGRDFTAADVKFTFEQLLAKLHPRTRTTLQRLESIETPDPLTVVMKLKDAYAPFLLQQTAFDAPILPKHLYETGDPATNPANQAPVGTGPFKFAEWNRGSNLKVVRNDQYWDQGKPYLDAIVFQVIPQGPNRSTGLETGEIDFVVDFYLPKADVGRLNSNQQLQSKLGQGFPAIDFMMMNTRTEALARKEARQAIALVVNRELLVQQAMNGLGRPGVGAFGNGFRWLVNEDVTYQKKYPLDVEKARSLLQQAGVAPNTTLRMVYDPARPQFASGSQIIRDNLRQIGLNVELQPLERSVMIQKVFIEHQYDLTLQSFVSSGDPSIGYHRLYITTNAPTQFTNQSGYSNPRVDELLQRAAVAPNQAERAAAYKEAQVILNEDLPSLVLFDEAGIDFATKKLNGLWQSIDSRDRWGEVWLSQ